MKDTQKFSTSAPKHANIPLVSSKEIEWKPVIVDGQVTKYRVSNTGLIMSLHGRQPRIIKPRISYDGYHNAQLYIGGKPKTIKVHRIVALAFIPNPAGLPEVNHIDGNKLNNRVSNLQWISRKENMQHAYDTGLCDIKGEANGRSKLSLSDVRDIKRQLATGRLQKDIAREFNVVIQTISKIKNGECWAGVAAAA